MAENQENCWCVDDEQIVLVWGFENDAIMGANEIVIRARKQL